RGQRVVAPAFATSSTESGSSSGGTTSGGSTTAVSGSTGDTGDTSTTGPACTPVSDDEVKCDGLDDDCNGVIDDVDAGGDGFCDCLRIALLGNPGSNPNAAFEAWLESQGTTVTRFGQQGEAITPELLAMYDVIILDWLPRAYSAEEAGFFKAWVEGGGGLMGMTGHTGDEGVAIAYPNSITSGLGVVYVGGMLLSQAVTEWVAHPLSDGLTSVTFLGGFRVGETMPGTATVIANLPQGPVAIAKQAGEGRIYLWGDEWVQFDSEWAQMPEIKTFWQNAVQWLTPQNFCTLPG
ncbi:MAG TPA: hypothetical protein PKW35_21595, partial [Nannocystaceae bacterium]|nr:hypothetical protein [Nannocystaceae bacterium]